MIDGMPLEDIQDAMQLAKLTHGEPGSAAVLKVCRPTGEIFGVVHCFSPFCVPISTHVMQDLA